MPKDRLARADHFLDQLSTLSGRPWPPYSGSAASAVQPPSRNSVVGFLEALGRAHHAVLVVAAFLVADGVEREQHFLAELGGFFENGVDQVAA